MTKRILYLFLILQLYSCEYPLDELENSGAIKPDKPPVIELGKNFTGDTIYLYKGLSVNLEFKADSAIDVSGYTLILDDDTISKSNYSFSLINYYIENGTGSPKGQLSLGIHKLQVNVYSHSSSGSIADGMGLERYFYTYFWYVNIRDFPNFLHFRTDTTSNVLKLCWDKYTPPDFKAYLFNSFWETQNNWIQESILDINKVCMEDSAYVGYPTYYYFDVKSSCGNIRIGSITASWSLPSFNKITYEDQKYYLNWNDSKYQHLISEYHIFTNSGKKTVVKDPNCRKFNITDVGFLTGSKYWVLPLSRYDNNRTNFSKYLRPESLACKTDLGEKYGSGYSYCGKAANGNFCFKISDENKCAIYNPTQGKVVKTLNYIFQSFSPNGRYGVFCSVESQMYYIICVYDLINDNMVYKLKTLDILDTNISVNFKISDNLIGVLSFGNNLVAYDFKEKKILASKQYYSKIWGIAVSSGGKYFYIDSESENEIDCIQNGSFVKKYNLNDKGCLFNPESEDEIVYSVADENKYILMNLDNGNKKTLLTGNGLLDIDFYNEQYVIYSVGYLSVWNFNNIKLFDIKTSLDLSFGLVNTGLALNNKILLHKNGYLLDMRSFY